ncbi:hypothetical protein [Ferrovibrio sp.]|uniref:hypothetical protein n=1 Tax=Ferrovibrio sp. TaxID=1917215 RepID=UPI00311E192A
MTSSQSGQGKKIRTERTHGRRLLRPFDALAADLRSVIGLIGRLYDDPHRIAQTHEPLLESIENGDTAHILAAFEYHLTDPWRGVAQLVATLATARSKPTEPTA